VGLPWHPQGRRQIRPRQPTLLSGSNLIRFAGYLLCHDLSELEDWRRGGLWHRILDELWGPKKGKKALILSECSWTGGLKDLRFCFALEAWRQQMAPGFCHCLCDRLPGPLAVHLWGLCPSSGPLLSIHGVSADLSAKLELLHSWHSQLCGRSSYADSSNCAEALHPNAQADELDKSSDRGPRGPRGAQREVQANGRIDSAGSSAALASPSELTGKRAVSLVAASGSSASEVMERMVSGVISKQHWAREIPRVQRKEREH
jgi:hypothetical protein